MRMIPAKSDLARRSVVVTTVVILGGLLGCTSLPKPQPRQGRAVSVDSSTYNGSSYVLITIDPSRVIFRMLTQDQNGAAFHSLEGFRQTVATSNPKFQVATNAGIFDDSITTTGLHVDEGRVKHALNLGDGNGNFYVKPNGVFYVDVAGEPHVVESKAAESRVPKMKVATQSGPLLAISGKLNPRIADWKGTATRNAIGVCADNMVRIVLTKTPVTMPALGELFLSLQCSDAVYLDGNVSGLILPDRTLVGSGSPVSAVLTVFSRE